MVNKLSRADFLNITVGKRGLLWTLPAISLLSDTVDVVDEIRGNSKPPEISFAENKTIGSNLVNIGVQHDSVFEKETEPTVTVVEKTDFFWPNGGFVLEGLMFHNYSYINPPKGFVEGMIATYKKKLFLKSAIEVATQNDLPLFLVDMVNNDSDKLLNGSDIFKRVVTGLSHGSTAFKLMLKLFNSLNKGSNQILEKLDKDTDLLLLPLIYAGSQSLAEVIDDIGLSKKTNQSLERFVTDLANPQDYLINMRNVVWALKINDLYEKGLIEKSFFIHLIAGNAHKSVGYFLQNPELAVEYWHAVHYDKVLRIIGHDNPTNQPDWVYKTGIIKPKDGSLEIIEHENLKKLAGF